MGRIPQSFINDLLDRVDVVDVVDARLTLKKAGKEYRALCPFHNEKTPSFWVSPAKQFYHCFGCGASGTALTFLMEFDRLEFVEAVETLAALVGLEVPREGGGRPQPDRSGLYEVLAEAERFFRRSLRASPEAVAYLKSRGLSGEVARDFGIGFAPASWDALRRALGSVPESQLLEAGLLTRNDAGRTYDRFRGRVMFPIRDTRGRIIGFGGRIIGAAETGPKYLNSPETPVFHKGRELYGLYEARRALRKLESLVVVEGYMDVVALAQAGVANAVATLGTSASTEQFQKLFRYTQEVVCCFDGDNAGRQAAWRALESALPVLGEGRQLRFMFLPEGEDPDTLVRSRGRAAFLELAGAADSAAEYLFKRLALGLDLNNLDHRARLASLAVPMIEKVPDGILKQLMSRRLQELTQFSASAPPRSTGEASPADPGTRRRPSQLSALSRRLLGRLLQHPRVLMSLTAADRQALLDDDQDDLFQEVVRYLAENPEADTAALLGRWSGTPAHGALLGVLHEAPRLSESAVQGEFAEGVTQYLEQRRRAERQRKLAGMHQEPSKAQFQEWWALRRSATEPKEG
ncbi:MAG: DNA primase [Pseudomonadota bacterium]